MMKNKKIIDFIKGKEFYFVLLLSFVTIFGISSYLVSKENNIKNKNDKNLVNLNEPMEQKKDSTLFEPAVSDDITDKENTSNQTDTRSKVDENKTRETKTSIETKQPESVEVMNNNSTKTKEPFALTFNEAQGLRWPIEGKVIIPFSMEKSIYFETLDQYKCSPAMFIQSMLDADVKSAAKGIVDKIDSTDELGRTITISHGNGYKTIYGQLKNIQVKEGDEVKAGMVIAQVEKPTIYYSKEGSHLYLQVNKDNEPIDPGKFLKQE